MMRIPQVKIGEELICPICGKIFTADENTCFFAKGEWNCSWECFRSYVKEREKFKKSK